MPKATSRPTFPDTAAGLKQLLGSDHRGASAALLAIASLSLAEQIGFVRRLAASERASGEVALQIGLRALRSQRLVEDFVDDEPAQLEAKTRAEEAVAAYVARLAGDSPERAAQALCALVRSDGVLEPWSIALCAKRPELLVQRVPAALLGRHLAVLGSEICAITPIGVCGTVTHGAGPGPGPQRDRFVEALCATMSGCEFDVPVLWTGTPGSAGAPRTLLEHCVSLGMVAQWRQAIEPASPRVRHAVAACLDDWLAEGAGARREDGAKLLELVELVIEDVARESPDRLRAWLAAPLWDVDTTGFSRPVTTLAMVCLDDPRPIDPDGKVNRAILDRAIACGGLDLRDALMAKRLVAWARPSALGYLISHGLDVSMQIEVAPGGGRTKTQATESMELADYAARLAAGMALEPDFDDGGGRAAWRRTNRTRTAQLLDAARKRAELREALGRAPAAGRDRAPA